MTLIDKTLENVGKKKSGEEIKWIKSIKVSTIENGVEWERESTADKWCPVRNCESRKEWWIIDFHFDSPFDLYWCTHTFRTWMRMRKRTHNWLLVGDGDGGWGRSNPKPRWKDPYTTERINKDSERETSEEKQRILIRIHKHTNTRDLFPLRLCQYWHDPKASNCTGFWWRSGVCRVN